MGFHHISSRSIFREGFLSKEYFCSFFNTFIYLNSTLTNVLISWRKFMELIFLHFIGVDTSLSCDYFGGSFRSVFILYIIISTRNLYDINVTSQTSDVKFTFQNPHRLIMLNFTLMSCYFLTTVCNPKIRCVSYIEILGLLRWKHNISWFISGWSRLEQNPLIVFQINLGTVLKFFSQPILTLADSFH